MTRKSSNWAKAPKSAEFVKNMREVFGEDVRVLYVEENGLKLGESTEPKEESCPA